MLGIYTAGVSVNLEADMRQIVLIDTFCLLHMLSEDIAKLGIPEARQQSYISAQLLVAASCDFLGHLKNAESSRVIFSVDDKTVPYWRTVMYPEYKAGRVKASHFQVVKSSSLETLERMPYPVLSVPTQESDDIIAAFTRLKPPDVELFIITVDSDLIGLVSETTPAVGGVAWFSMSDRWTPRLRDSLETINRWCFKRHKILLEKPSDLWEFKCDTGDKADNLPPGTPSYMIDLLNPYPRYDIMLNTPVIETITDLLAPAHPSSVITQHPQLAQAKLWLKKNGYREAIAPFKSEALRVKTPTE